MTNPPESPHEDYIRSGQAQMDLGKKGLDFADAALIFAGDYLELLDDRKNYREIRYRVFGKLKGRQVAIIWTPRGHSRRNHFNEICT